MLRPIGDISGDGSVDFAASRLQSDGLTPNVFPPDEFYHAVTHVYFGDDSSDLQNRLSAAAASPNLVLEKTDASVRRATSSVIVPYMTPRFDSLGDVNGDGVDDFAPFSAFRANLAVVFGDALEANTGVNPVEPNAPVNAYQHERISTAWRAPLTPSEQTAQPGINILDPSSVDLADAITLEGKLTGLLLDGVRSIGDVNGDGIVDMVCHKS